AVSPTPGQKIRCPKCKEVFAVPEPEVVSEAELVEEEEDEAEAITDRPRKGRKVIRPTRRRRDEDEEDQDEEEDREEDEDEEEDDDDRPRRKKKKKKKKGTSPVVWIVLAVVLLLGGGALYFFVFSGPSVKLGRGKEAKDYGEVLKQKLAVYKEQSYH